MEVRTGLLGHDGGEALGDQPTLDVYDVHFRQYMAPQLEVYMFLMGVQIYLL